MCAAALTHIKEPGVLFRTVGLLRGWLHHTFTRKHHACWARVLPHIHTHGHIFPAFEWKTGFIFYGGTLLLLQTLIRSNITYIATSSFLPQFFDQVFLSLSSFLYLFQVRIGPSGDLDGPVGPKSKNEIQNHF